MMDIQKLTKEDVLRVYSGRPGCRCGCKGTYRAPACNAKQAEASCGYKLDDEDISDRQVTRVLNVLKRNSDDCHQELADPKCKYINLEFNGRVYTAYLK